LATDKLYTRLRRTPRGGNLEDFGGVDKNPQIVDTFTDSSSYLTKNVNKDTLAPHILFFAGYLIRDSIVDTPKS